MSMDTQSFHNFDEIYYVIEGEGLIPIGTRDHEVFVPANTLHHFHRNLRDLMVLYLLVVKAIR